MNTASILEDIGHEVTQVFSGDQALDIVRSGARFDVVITDYAMPRMTGTELADALQSIAPQLPIILATGYAELPSGEEVILPRLPKPFFQRDVEVALKKLKTN